MLKGCRNKRAITLFTHQGEELGNGVSRFVTELTDEMIADLAAQWRTRELAEDDRYRIEGAMLTVLEEDVGNLQSLEQHMRGALARGDLKQVEAATDDVLQHAAIRLPKSSESYRKLSMRLLKEGMKLLADLQGRTVGT